MAKRLSALGAIAACAAAASCGLTTVGLGTVDTLSPEAGFDANTPDATGDDADNGDARDDSVVEPSDAAADGAADAKQDADADASADATSDAKDSAPETGTDGGVACVVGATATLLCDNFDDAVTGWASFWTTVNPNGLLASDLTSYVSAPKSVSASVLVATPDGYQVGLYKQIAFGSTVTIDLDYNATTASGYVEIVQVMFGTTDDARFLASTADTTSFINGYAATPRLGASTGASTLGAWHHAHVVFVFATSGGKVSMSIDGAPPIVSGSGNTLGAARSTLDIHVGSSPGTGQGASKVNVDNFVLSVAP